MLCGEPAKSSYGSAYQAVLEDSEACAEIPQRHISAQIVVQMDRGSEDSRLHRCGLGRESIKPEEYFWRNLQPWFFYQRLSSASLVGFELYHTLDLWFAANI